jgi:hypothetical protein
MNEDTFLRLNEKLETLESRLESQENELTKIVYSKTFSILNQTDAENVKQILERRRSSAPKTRQNKSDSKANQLHTALKNHVLEWMLVTTWSGPGTIIRVKSVFSKIYYIVLFFLCMAATVYVMILTINAYLQYSEVTSITTTIDYPTFFPTVIVLLNICLPISYKKKLPLTLSVTKPLLTKCHFHCTL